MESRPAKRADPAQDSAVAVDSRQLIYEPSEGKPPNPETVAGHLFRACCDADQETLDLLCEVPMSELESAIEELQSLGWKFRLAILQ